METIIWIFMSSSENIPGHMSFPWYRLRPEAAFDLRSQLSYNLEMFGKRQP